MLLFQVILKQFVLLEMPIQLLKKEESILAPGLFGPCGYGFPSVLGAKIGCPNTPVVGFAGDGAFGISMSEMTSCNRDDWPNITMVIVLEITNGVLKKEILYCGIIIILLEQN